MSEPTVHVVDDDLPSLVSMSRWLRASGFVVKTYMSASDFLAQQDVGMPGCVVVDLRMLAIGGLEAALALAVQVFGAARPHHAYLFTNRVPTA